MIDLHRRQLFQRGAILLSLMLLALPAVWSQNATHVVRKGETLYSIARRYAVTTDAVASRNQITAPFKISIGQTLVIPQASRDSQTHTVKPGDTYYNISRRYRVALNELLRINNRTRADLLGIGETLRLPGERGNLAASTAAAGALTISAQQAAAPRASVQIASTSGLFWPHSGARTPMTGKFPGIMIRGSRGDDIVSVSTGRVIYAGPHTSFGRVVLVQSSEGHIYVYGGQDNLAVQVGDIITPGTSIGRLGESRLNSAPSLYFSVWSNNDFIDPVAAPRG